jgi:hypothetical protein
VSSERQGIIYTVGLRTDHLVTHPNERQHHLASTYHHYYYLLPQVNEYHHHCQCHDYTTMSTATVTTHDDDAPQLYNDDVAPQL